MVVLEGGSENTKIRTGEGRVVCEGTTPHKTSPLSSTSPEGEEGASEAGGTSGNAPRNVLDSEECGTNLALALALAFWAARNTLSHTHIHRQAHVTHIYTHM